MDVYFLGRAPYRETWALQERLRDRVLAGGSEALLLCEHPPVLTLGRSAQPSDVLADDATLQRQGIEVCRTSRGGQVTYHGPGQLVVYPIVRLRRGIVAHVEWLAAAAIDVAAGVGLHAVYDRGRVGVWLDARKLAAIGVQVSRRVTVHGMALNVTRESTGPVEKRWFVPCGEAQGRAISLQEACDSVVGTRPSLVSVAAFVQPLADALLRRAGHPAAAARSTNVSLLSQSLSVE